MNTEQTSNSAVVFGPTCTPEWLYDTLMQEIEPDLTTNHIPLLDQKYAGEPEEETAIRMEQYAAAFIIFDECLADLDKDMQNVMKDVEQDMRQAVLRESAEEDAEALHTLEQSLDHSDSQL